MSRKIAGVNVLLKVKKGNEYIAVGGQKGASLSRTAETIDVSDKTSGGWSESIVGLKSWSLECEGFVTLGDNGFNLIYEAFEVGSILEVEINVGDESGYRYTGNVIVTEFPEEYAQDDAVTYNLSMQGVSKLVKIENNSDTK